MVVPNFIGIGAPRCGTTWVAEALRFHPEIYIPSNHKEIHFFDQHFHKGIKWYKNNFSQQKENQITGEITPRYLRGKQTAKIIFQHFPKVKLIVCLRDPIERAFSHYQYLNNFSNISNSFYDSLFDERYEILKSGKYGEQLERYLRLFQRDQIHIILYDDIISAPEEVITRLYAFLDVNTFFRSSNLWKKSNVGYDVKSKSVAFITRRIKKIVRPFSILRNGLRIMGFYRLGKIINKYNTRVRLDASAMEQRAVEHMIVYYENDLNKLNNILDGKISHWIREE